MPYAHPSLQLALTTADIIVFVLLAMLAASLGIWRARRRMASRRRKGAFRSIVLFRTATSEWEPDALYGAIEAALGPVASIETAEIPAKKATFYRVRLKDSRNFMLIDTDQPYVDRPQEASRFVADARVREALATHTAWSSIDALDPMPDDVAETSIMPLMGKIISSLDDGKTLAMHRRDTQRFALPTPDTFARLSGGDLSGAFAIR